MIEADLTDSGRLLVDEQPAEQLHDAPGRIMVEPCPPADAVFPVYLHSGQVSHSFLDSMMKLAAYDLVGSRRVFSSGGPLAIRCPTGGVADARNTGLAWWLDNTSAGWLWFVDTDMGFAPDTIDRLVAAAGPDIERPVIGALAFGNKEIIEDGLGGFRTSPFPTLYDFGAALTGMPGFVPRMRYTPNVVTPVAGTGAACLLIHRSAAEKVVAQLSDLEQPFDRVRYGNGVHVSEDLSFCYRLGKAGVPVHVHTGVHTSHHKQVWLSAGDYQQPAPPLTVEVPDNE